MSRKKYYFAGSQRIAMRTGTSTTDNSNLTYLFGDHLGSASVTASGVDGSNVSVLRYKPCPDSGGLRTGEPRYVDGVTTTDRRYTGQRAEGIGLYDYRARWLRSVPVAQRRGYDPSLGRFSQADTVVPLASQGSQAWDRYAYVNNNPLRYSDASGHCISDPFSLFVCAMVGGAIVGGAINAYNQYKETGSVDLGQVAEAAVGGALVASGVVITGAAVVTVGSGLVAAGGVATTIGGAVIADGDPSNEVTAIASALSADGDPTNEITVGTNILNYPSGTGFSSAYDSSTGAMEFMPSINSPTPPSGWVQQFGGHRVVADSMIAKGSNFSDLAGFAVESKLPNALNIVSWNSGVINFRNYGDRVAPLEIQTRIINALQSGGWQVNAR